MPLPDDQQAVEVAKDLISTLKGAFGTPPGYRPAHAKGVLLTGTFTPSSTASSLSSAYHLNNVTPVTARFSSSTGIPTIPDTDANADPRGFAVRFHYPEKNGRRVHTDIVSHSVDKFPTRTGAEFLEFLQAVGASQGAPEPTPVQKFLGSHPETLDFVQAPKPPPASFAEEPFFGVTAFKLINGDKETFVRYRIVPTAGVHQLSADEVSSKGPNYLIEEIHERVANGPVTFKLNAQVAEAGDTTDNNTVHWPESRQVVELGEIKLDKVEPDDKQAAEQKNIIFDPIPRVEGLAPSADPLLDVRAALYLISGKERRAA
ncbi:catalase related subgroup [Rhizodiscina lignyota]|uniref:Catalase related subgroup n=1 Tax=Rhizodiscina lignyota TaxID=1504668 RepID=A0A9P4IHL2_9PEZI|nr:catalase related subgroup [Rhizodiscina lignyota]